MTSRKRKSSTPSTPKERRNRRSKSNNRKSKRHSLLETLETRHLLAGPQLIGIQPNEGALIENGSVRDTAPRLLTFGFDEAQAIDTNSLEGIRITRSGDNGVFDTGIDDDDDVLIEPGLVSLGQPNENEVVVRFAESLPDDNYRIEVFGFDDPALGITGLKNQDGEFFQPADPDQRSQIIDFELKLGALIESIVPQPVIRNTDGSLTQNRDEIVVYFNEDPLFVEDDADGNPTERSAENPRFYTLLFTQETVRNSDDLRFHPTEVVYDAETHTARLFFGRDINTLSNAMGSVPAEGGTFRLRIGTAVDERVDLILNPETRLSQPSAVTDFQHDGLRVTFASPTAGEAAAGTQIRFVDSGSQGLTASASGNVVTFDLGGQASDVRDLVGAIAADPAVSSLVFVNWERDGVAGSGGRLSIPLSVVGQAPLVMNAAGDTLSSSLDVGVFGLTDAFGQSLQSIVFEGAIEPQQFDIELPGGDDDPGHADTVHINPSFGADTLNGVTEVAYNFNGIFETDPAGNSVLNQITELQKTRIREAFDLWSARIGVQFRETADEGITVALGDTADLRPRPGIGISREFTLDAALRIDPTFTDSALVFSNQTQFEVVYGADFTRKAVASIGLLLGLNQTPDIPAPNLMNLGGLALNSSIDLLETVPEPVFPNNVDVLHGQYVHRPDSNDIDLFRFVVDLDDADKVGTLTAEAFAERLPDSSLLDTTLTLFREESAVALTDLGIGTDLEIEIRSLTPGLRGNNARLDFIRTDRGVGDTTVKILPAFDESGNTLANGLIVDLPRIGANVSSVSAGEVVDAINNSPLSSAIFRASITTGDASLEIGSAPLNYSPVLLAGGGLEQISRNDDYFGEDSRIITSLGEGVYYVGVAASGNDRYNPTIPDSGFGGRTQGEYELHLKFEPQVDEVDVIRDLDSDRPGVPGSELDGDGDGIPGGIHNFWFQTRPLNRIVEFTDEGDAIVPGQTITVTGANSVERVFEFVPLGVSPTPGNIAIQYNAGLTGFPTPSGILATTLQGEINSRVNDLGVNVALDGSVLTFTGERSIKFSDDFRGATAFGRNLFVDKAAGPLSDGSLDRPFNNIANPVVANAFGSAIEGDIVRIVGNGGLDNEIESENDNFSYQIGVSDVGGRTLEDGRSMEVPLGVTTMIDAGAIIKLRNSFIGIGSSTVQVDRSGGALQVLGTPRLVDFDRPATERVLVHPSDALSSYDNGSVIFTSTRDRDADESAAGISPDPAPGNWGGLIYRRDIDRAQGRRDLEDEGIFLQRVNHAELRYGGGSNVLIDSIQQLVNPIQIVNMRPTVTFNEITQSSDSAISAAPDSFEETSYQSPVFQQAGQFTADYDRVGPEIHNNRLVDNSINGLFIRATTTPTESAREFTVSTRFDDIDVVHYVAENLIVQAQPGGSIQDGISPSMDLVSGQRLAGGDLPGGVYEYRMTFVDRNGFESLASSDTALVSVAAAESSVALNALPAVPSNGDYISRRLYRSVSGTGRFVLVGELDGTATQFIDRGAEGDFVLQDREGIRGRLDASMVFDPGLVVKINGARIELEPGTQLLAEGVESNPIIFTSSRDDRFGAGGTFDTNNDDSSIDLNNPDDGRADWSGLYAGPTSNISLDYATVAYAGGISLIEGGFSRGFTPLELQQATARVTNSQFEFNDSGQDGAGPAGRFGRLAVSPSTIFVRGSQPVIVGNTFLDNRGTIIDIDIESMRGNNRQDTGRETGDTDRISELDDNHGPLIRFNRYLNVPTAQGTDQQLSGLEIRAGVIHAETVFDDTDIAHLLFEDIQVGDLHSDGSLRLLSRPDESLVVKFNGPGTQFDDHAGTGLTALGAVSNIEDRVGGTIHVLGHPGAPVVLTSLHDDTVGAGLKPDGSRFTDHDGDGIFRRPFSNDWRGVLLDQFSNDYNVNAIQEQELATEIAPGLNATVENAQVLGELASDALTGDHDRRLGFDVAGFLSGVNDIDAYSFIGTPGTEVWVDIDKTNFTLDTVIEVLDESGTVLARSDNSFAETTPGGDSVVVFDDDLQGLTTSLQVTDENFTARGVGGLYEDFGSTNPRDAGIHFRLAGNTADPNSRSVYFFRVRSASINPDDASGGITSGAYRFQVRIQEDQVFPGSVVRHADIRYANHGIHVRGLMSSSPLSAEVQENEAANEARLLAGGALDVNQIGAANNDRLPSFGLQNAFGNLPQYVGDLNFSANNVIGIGGELSTTNDVDFYHFEVTELQSTVFDIDFADGFNRPDTSIAVFYDADAQLSFDGTGVYQPQLVYFGMNGNVADDLTSPDGENSEFEKLRRGSVSDGDPFIGPVTLIPGTYYVAVSASGFEPSTFAGSVVEPVNSVARIVEDRIDRIGAEEFSTAEPPVLPRLFSDASIAASPFSITTNNQVGHGRPNHLDGTTIAPPLPVPSIPSVERLTFVDIGGELDAEDGIGPDHGISLLDGLEWGVNDDPDVGGQDGQVTSTFIPHTSVFGEIGGEEADVYGFTVQPNPLDPTDLFTPQTVILDIDDGLDTTVLVDDDDDPLTLDVVLDPNGFESELLVFDALGNLVARSADTSSLFDGAQGSNSEEDAFLQTQLTPGFYFVAVVEDGSTFSTDGSGNVIFAAPDPANDIINVDGDYTLHVSVGSNFSLVDPGDFDDSFSEGRDVLSGQGTIVSESFSLAGYDADDVPLLYFNALKGLAGDASVTIANADSSLSVTQDIPQTLFFDQLRVPLGELAGESDLRVTINSAVPVELDDFIIGFGERGETVFEAATGSFYQAANGFGFVPGAAGSYQLEMRLATEFASDTGGGGFFGGATTSLDATFDTNYRHNRSVTLIAPSRAQVADGDTFVLGDGGTNLTFEFDNNGIVEFGNATVDFSSAVTAAEIAQEIRTAINSQSLVNLEAASSGGADVTDTTDARLALHGNATGTFVVIPTGSHLDAPAGALSRDADGHLELAIIQHDGVGDTNFIRPQGQVIIEHNTISDVNGIGIWSEPGDRDINPNHIRPDIVSSNFLLEAPPVGNTYPGAAINFPELNDSVLGGLAPGVVIQNNTIDQAQYAGIKIDGEIAPMMIIAPQTGDLVTDGETFAIDAAGTRVVFEWEDIGDGPGSINGGDGVRDGNVPVYYRATDDGGGVYRGRGSAYTHLELTHAMRDAIQGSILMHNGMVSLVEPTVGPSLFGLVPGFGTGDLYRDAALYIQGASMVYFGLPTTNFLVEQAPVAESVQPFARIVNNTIYGEDGTERLFPASFAEPNDFLISAVDTKLGNSHLDTYVQSAELGDNSGPVVPSGDVDFYKVDLKVGDRLLVDIDTLDAIAGAPDGPDTFVTIFDSSGIPVASNEAGVAPDRLNLGAVAEVDNGRDPYIDFLAPETDTYFVGISGAGNDSYDSQSLSGRVPSPSGIGSYQIGLKVLAPRSFLVSIQDGSGNSAAPVSGTVNFGGTIRVTHVEDAGPGNNLINTRDFDIDGGSASVLGSNDSGDIRVSALMKNLAQDIVAARLPNGDAIPAVTAQALGGRDALGDFFAFDQNLDVVLGTGIGLEMFDPFLNGEFNTQGFGHARYQSIDDGSTELYVLIENAVDVEIIDSNGGSLFVDPEPGRDTDQALNETGVLVAGGASPTLLNNVFLNLHESVVREETTFVGFNGDSTRGTDQHRKPQEVILAASVFQHHSGEITQRSENSFFIPGSGFDNGISTAPGVPSNVNGGNDDFNVILADNAPIPTLQNPAGDNFQPAPNSPIIDSSVDSLNERDAMVNLRNSVGLPVSNIVAPDTDVAGILRADNFDFVSPFPGIGTSVFKDRGSSELADFVGPIAIAEVPRDNDAEGIDSDPAIGVINLTGGIYDEFRVQLRDNGDASDPFAGIGIDDATVVVPEIPGVRPSGGNITLFENERPLLEGIDYTFNYDETKNIITLTPLAGVWRGDRAYRIALNNLDQSVMVAQAGSNLEDGQQFTITDSNSGMVVFEFETGYQLLLPEALTLIVPQEGTNTGGLRDGDIFQVDDGQNAPVVFEYDADGVTLPGSVRVELPSRATPPDLPSLGAFLNEIAVATETAILDEVAAGNLDLDVSVREDRLIIGAEQGTTIRTTGSGLLQATRTLALHVPEAGTDPLVGILPGDSFTINDGTEILTFAFDDGVVPIPATSIPVNISNGPRTGAQVRAAIQAAIAGSALAVIPSIVGETVYLNLPEVGTVTAAPGQLTVVGVARTPLDGNSIVDDGLQLPEAGSDPALGVQPGDGFTINDGVLTARFAFDDGVTPIPAGSLPVDISNGPLNGTELAVVIQDTIIASPVSLVPTAVGTVVELNLPAGGDLTLESEQLSLVGVPRVTGDTITISPVVVNDVLQIPEAGSDPLLGVQAGDGFTINDGFLVQQFVFDDGVTSIPQGSLPIDISGGPRSGAELAVLIRDVVDASPISLSPVANGNTVEFNMQTGDSLTLASTALTLGTLDNDLVFELNRTDEPDPVTGGTMNDFVSDGSIEIPFNRSTTANELAEAIASQIRIPSIRGLNPAVVQANGGLLAVGGEAGLGISVTGGSVQIVGSPSVTESSTLTVSGPLLLNPPVIGGSNVVDGSVLIIQDDLGNDVLFEFDSDAVQIHDGTGGGPTSNLIFFQTFDDANTIGQSVANAINLAAIGVTATALPGGQVNLGQIGPERINLNGDLAINATGAPQFTTQRGIVSDGEFFSIAQGGTEVIFEFEDAVNGGGVEQGRVAVAFQAGSTVADVVEGLAASINNNRGSLRVVASAVVDANGNPTGEVSLNDIPGTVVDVSGATTLSLSGVPGGAIPVRISSSSTAEDVKSALITAVNSINTPGQLPSTNLSASDRGGDTLFIENALLFDTPLTTYFLPAIKDLSGNPLEANRDDLTTQFTILMPTVGLDFGDAPDPVATVPGRYPTTFVNDGPRHAVDGNLVLGRIVDIDVDGRPVAAADGDDSVIEITSTGTLFDVSVVDGVAQIGTTRRVRDLNDGDTITINTGVDIATLELDRDGIFNEDNFAIRSVSDTSADLTAAIVAAIAESPLRPAEVTTDGLTVFVNSDDEDGVSFVSLINPTGSLNKGISTPVSVTVTGTGVVEAWIDFNADGDWDDPGEQIISRALTPDASFVESIDSFGNPIPVTRTFTVSVPETTPDPPSPLTTYARFRVSREGGLAPTGLSLSGEVEDYALLILPGSPPDVSQGSQRSYTVAEDSVLQVLDVDGNLTSTANDDGLLLVRTDCSIVDGPCVSDPDGDAVAIVAEDTGARVVRQDPADPDSPIIGDLNVTPDGTFTFEPVADFNGIATFTVRVKDVNSQNPESEVVSSTPITVKVTVNPVNDAPFSEPGQQIVVEFAEPDNALPEDTVLILRASELIDPFYQTGPANESEQLLFFQSVSSSLGAFTTSLGGSVVIKEDPALSTVQGLDDFVLEYTPPADRNNVVDTFTYVVADIPAEGQLSRQAPIQGTVSISLSPVNDPPRLVDDLFDDAAEDVPYRIAINGANGILANDSPGPNDESGQTISLVRFQTDSFRGGRVERVGDELVYTPPNLFSGTDQFEYTVSDSLAESTGRVVIIVGGVNNEPEFIGIDGVVGDATLNREESKETARVETFDLSTWFNEPESETLTFNVVSSDPSIVRVDQPNGGSALNLTFPPFAFGTATLTVTATDPQGAFGTANIQVNVVNTADPPIVIDTLDPVAGLEDQNLVRDLSRVFADRDGEQLVYSVGRLRNTPNPTAQEIARDELIQSITFVGDQIRIVPQPNQSGEVNVEIVATDADLRRVSDSFTVTITPQRDAPIALGDSYSVPVGSQLQILNPSEGLLRNDSDADGDTILVDLDSVTGTTLGTLEVNADGTFTYVNTSGGVGDVDSFQYRTIDNADPIDARSSAPVVVSITLNQSAYQNPIGDLTEDVTADGLVTAIDALRIINLINRSSLPNTVGVPISAIGAPPPDYFDVNGDGTVTALDALLVINKLSQRSTSGEGEASAVRFGVTTAFAATSDNLPVSNVAQVERTAETGVLETRDELLARGFSIDQQTEVSAAESLLELSNAEKDDSAETVDDALSLLVDEIGLI